MLTRIGIRTTLALAEEVIIPLIDLLHVLVWSTLSIAEERGETVVAPWAALTFTDPEEVVLDRITARVTDDSAVAGSRLAIVCKVRAGISNAPRMRRSSLT